MLSRSCRPSGHAGSRKRSGWSLAPSSQSAQRRLIPTRRRGGAPVRSRCHRSARTLGTWLACRWWRRDGKALAGRVRRCCREAAAPPGTPFLGNDPGGAWRLPLNPHSDDSSRLVDEGGAPVRSRCHRSARTLGTWLACRWWRRDGKPLAGRVRRCCREAAAPPGTPFRGNDPGGGWRLPLNPRSDDSSRLVDEVAHRCGRGFIAPPAPLGPGWRVTGGGVMARHWQDACVDAVAKLPPVWHPVSGNDPGSSFARPLSPRRDSSRLVHEDGALLRSRCHRSARTLGTWLAVSLVAA